MPQWACSLVVSTFFSVSRLTHQKVKNLAFGSKTESLSKTKKQSKKKKGQQNIVSNIAKNSTAFQFPHTAKALIEAQKSD